MKTRITACFLLLGTLISSLDYSLLAQSFTNVGKDFWIAFAYNNGNNPAHQVKLFISSEYTTSGSVFSLTPGVNQDFTVVPGIITELILPTAVALQINGGIENKGVRITSEDPISVYPLNRSPACTDAYTALPVPALGTDYYVLTYKTVISDDASRLFVVATENNTVITVNNRWTNSTAQWSLNKGQVYSTPKYGVTNQDITGSRIQSNHPVAVFGSNDNVNIPVASCQAADHCEEQMFPITAWGRNFGTVPLAGRDKSGDIFRVLAATDGTNITINGVHAANINTGEYFERNLAGYNYITASNPVMLAQFAKGIGCTGHINGDPFEMLIPPMEQFLKHYTIATVYPFGTHWVNLVVPDYALGTITEDGALVPVSAFTKIGLSNYYGTQRSVNMGTHNYDSPNPFGVFVYGWNQADSYGYPGGCSMSQVAKVKTLTLIPDTSYGQLNVTTVCLTANARDDQGLAVAGVLITFHISGMGVITATAYTDSLGNAQYCYTRTGSTPGTDHVYAEVSGITSNTVVAFWYLVPPCIDPTKGGAIGDPQTGCTGFIPSPMVSKELPSGQSGTLQYKWQGSITGNSSGFTDIPLSDSAWYRPGSLSVTSWFRRLARVSCKPDWSGAAMSNVVEIGIFPILVAGISISPYSDTVCDGSEVSLTAIPVNGGTAPSYQWIVNGLNTGHGNPSYSYIPKEGDSIRCILTSSMGCAVNNPASSNTLILHVRQKLPVSVSLNYLPDPACIGDTVTVHAIPVNGGDSPYYLWWLNGASTWTNFPDFRLVPSNGDQVIVSMRSNLSCVLNLSASDTVILKLNVKTEVIDTTICWGIKYYAGGKWRTTAGTYIDTLPAPVNCVLYKETRLHYKPQIAADLGPDTNLCVIPLILSVPIPNASFLWQDGNTDSAYRVVKPGMYWVRVMADECRVSDTVVISECPYRLFFPNAFSPNGDGLNDTFHPVGNEVPEYSMKIFNRWGQMIFETDIMIPGWDGTFKGEPSGPDTYIYLVTYKSLDGETLQFKGYVVLTR